MSFAFTLLLIPIALSPAFAIIDGIFAQSLAAVLAVVALAGVGLSARATDVALAERSTRWLRIGSAVPAIWMVAQLLPLPFGSHSIWVNASEALAEKLLGHISIDLGNTLIALAFYLAMLGFVIASLFVSRDRRRAEQLLLALVVISIVAVAGLIADKIIRVQTGLLASVSAVGLVASLALATHAADRFQNKRVDANGPLPNRRSKFVLMFCAIAVLLCLVGLILDATLNVAIVTLFAVAVFGSVQAIRRAALPNWTAPLMLITLVVAAAMIVAWRYDPSRALSPLLQFASAASIDALSITQRMLSDTPWRGSGAGTFPALAPIYQELGKPIVRAPTTAADLAIELGWPMALFCLGGAIYLIGVLYRGALNRGRDFVYPAAAGSLGVFIIGDAFCDASLFNPSMAIASAALLGLGLAQSTSSEGF